MWVYIQSSYFSCILHSRDCSVIVWTRKKCISDLYGSFPKEELTIPHFPPCIQPIRCLHSYTCISLMLSNSMAQCTRLAWSLRDGIHSDVPGRASLPSPKSSQAFDLDQARPGVV